MKYLFYFFVLVILAGLQTGLFSYFRFFGATPNLILLFILGVCLQREGGDWIFVALMGGLLTDYSTGMLPGTFTISFLSAAVLLYLTIHNLVVFELNWKYLVGVVILFTLIANLLSWIISNFALMHSWTQAAIDLRVSAAQFLPATIYNIALAYPVYMLASWLWQLILKYQGKRHRII